MTGLVNFIRELRHSRAHELEAKRVNKELANIRLKFKDGNLNGYNKRKYVAKLLYMYVLGFEIDFGHLECVNLMASIKYQEKQMAYLAATMMISENHELAPLVVNSVRKDLDSTNINFSSLALHAVTNIASRELADLMVNDVFKMFTSGSVSTEIKKKAGLCLLRIYRKYPELVPGDLWAQDILAVINDSNLAVVNSAVALIIALAQQYEEAYRPAVVKIINRLHKVY